MASDLTGQTIGSFYIERILGKGAMGAVYLGKHKEKGLYSAIKVVDPGKKEASPLMQQRFEREISLLKRFNHKNIVKFRDAGVHNGCRYYAMDYVEGETLEAVLAKKERLPVSTACQLIWQLCDALEEMHSEGVVHRDLKPANVMIDKAGVLKLTDLGIAKDTSQVFNSKLTEADTTVGTVAYMAPEQLAGKDLSRRSDLYSMGIMFYQLLTGRLPFTGRTVYEYINQRQAGSFPRPSAVNTKIPYELDQLVVELMKQNPEERPRDARVVQQRIKEIADKSRQGTLTKTSEMSGGDLAATEEMKTPPKGIWKATSAVASTLTRSLTGSASRKKKKSSDEPFWESPIFLVALLVLIVGIVWWAMRPLGEEQLFVRGKELMETEYRSNWDIAMEKYFDPLLQRFPNTAHREKIDEYRDQVLVADCEGRVTWAHKLGRLPDDASEAFRKYFEADSVRTLLNNKTLANEQFKAIATLFENDPKSRGWALLARRQLVDEGKEVPESTRVTAKREALKDAIAKAGDLRQKGNVADYFRISDSILNLYSADPEVADLVKQLKDEVEAARGLLRGK
jgi:eukaryotic-like serine/threonine-protein kinase